MLTYLVLAAVRGTGTSTIGEWTKLVAAVAGALGAIAGIAAVLVKYFPPRATTLAEEVALCKAETQAIGRTVNTLTDYVHELRADVVALGGTPRDWPEGLRM